MRTGRISVTAAVDRHGDRCGGIRVAFDNCCGDHRIDIVRRNLKLRSRLDAGQTSHDQLASFCDELGDIRRLITKNQCAHLQVPAAENSG